MSTIPTSLLHLWSPFLLGALALCGMSGCPGTQNDFSGRYIEQREGLQEEVMVIDYFRFGDYSNAVVRTFLAPSVGAIDSEGRLRQQIECRWTGVGNAPSDSNEVRLELPSALDESLQTTGMEGVFEEEGDTLVMRFRPPEGGPEVVRRFLKVSDAPDNVCDEIRPFLIQPEFDRPDTLPNQLSSAQTALLRRPTFALLWLGVQPRTSSGGTIVWIAKSEVKNFLALSPDNLLPGQNILQQELNLSVYPPSDSSLVPSGSTRYALAHFIVVDDQCPRGQDLVQGRCTEPSTQRFGWDVDEEPIVATALQLGVEQGEGAPRGAVGLGKALFFVEGSLSQLDPDLLSIVEHASRYSTKRENAHFYIVDIFFDSNRNVVKMRLPPDPQSTAFTNYRTIHMRMTSEYLGATQILLPRLFPL